MAPTKPPTTWRPAAAGNFKVGRSYPVSRITFHHIVGDAPAAINRFQTPGVEVSSTYVIGSNGQLYQMVDEANTPYTDGNFDSNSRTISIEHAGGHPSVAYTEAMYQKSIQLVAHLIAKYKITDFKRHRDISATACPGGLDVERIVREARALINQGGDMPTLTSKEDLDRLYLYDLGRPRGAGEGENVYLNKDYRFVHIDLLNSREAQNRRKAEADRLANLEAEAAKVPALSARVTELGAVVANLQKQIDSLKASQGDSTKWQTLKALLKELLTLNK